MSNSNNSGMSSMNASTNLGGYKTTPMISWARDTGIVVLVLVVMLVIILLLVYIIRVFKMTGLKQSDLSSNLIFLNQRANLPIVLPASQLAPVTRGQEFSFSFWIQLDGYYENSLYNKILFMRGNNPSASSNIDVASNPVVLLDKATNIMYFALRTTTEAGSIINVNDITSSTGSATHMVAKVDYIPLQRWIHFVMVLRDNTLTVFMDGDIYSITTTNDVKTLTGARPLIKGSSGDVLIGDPNNPINGVLGKFSFYNYGLTQKQVQNIYKAGPMNKTMLSYVGIGNYGLRSPIYNMDTS